MILSEISNFLEQIAPLSYQESYDNSGLLVGNPQKEVKKALISLDCTEEVVDEAIREGADLIISHHPIVFSGLKKFNGKTYIERVVMKAIRNDIALYAIHTNLDNVYQGVNHKIIEKIGLKDAQILSPKRGLLKKLVTFIPAAYSEQLRTALFEAGAGNIGEYSECSYESSGQGTFKASLAAKPFTGKKEERHTENEQRIEFVFQDYLESKLIRVLKTVHPYEEPAYDVYRLENKYEGVGSGMIARLDEPVEGHDFLRLLKERLDLKLIRYTKLLDKNIQKVAVCGGSGSFLLKEAIAAGADIFITADYKYHQFFDAEDKIIIADIGHYESERFTMDLLLEKIQNKFPTFALCLTKINTNPVRYFI